MTYFTVTFLLIIFSLKLNGQSNAYPTSGNVEINTGKLLIQTNIWRDALITLSDTHYSPYQIFNFQIESDGLKLRQDNNVNYQFKSGGDFILNNGKLGIGTYTPSGKLQIETNTHLESLLTLKDTHYSPSQVYNFQIESDGLKIKQDNSVNYQFRSGGDFIVNNGKVGIGATAPDYKLTVDGGIRAFTIASGDDIHFRSSRILTSAIQGLNVIASSTNNNKVVWGVIGQATSSYNLPNTSTAIGVYGEASSPSGSYAGWFNGDLAYSGNFGKPSDRNLKENIKELTNSLDLIMKIKPMKFSYKKIDGLNFPMGDQVGFIAQDIKEIIPTLVNSNGLPLPNLTNETDSIKTENRFEKYLTVDYVGLIPYIVKSIQDQQQIIQQQSTLIQALIEKDSIASVTNAISGNIPHIVKLFPNPAQNNLHLELFTNKQPSVIIIYNDSGKIYKSITTDESTLQVSLDNFENGIYLISLSISGTVLDIKRFIVSK